MSEKPPTPPTADVIEAAKAFARSREVSTVDAEYWSEFATEWAASQTAAMSARTEELERENLKLRHHSCISWPTDESRFNDEKLTCVWLADGRKVIIQRDGNRTWLRVSESAKIKALADAEGK